MRAVRAASCASCSSTSSATVDRSCALSISWNSSWACLAPRAISRPSSLNSLTAASASELSAIPCIAVMEKPLVPKISATSTHTTPNSLPPRDRLRRERRFARLAGRAGGGGGASAGCCSVGCCCRVDCVGACTSGARVAVMEGSGGGRALVGELSEAALQPRGHRGELVCGGGELADDAAGGGCGGGDRGHRLGDLAGSGGGLGQPPAHLVGGSGLLLHRRGDGVLQTVDPVDDVGDLVDRAR